MTHEEAFIQNGFDICSPVSGSMRPMIRTRRDSVLFVPVEGRAKPYDVVLYRVRGQVIMHRVIKTMQGGYWIRGDNSMYAEFVKEEQLMGVMKGFYRDERYISKRNPVYLCYTRIWVAMYPVLRICKKGKRMLRNRHFRRTNVGN